MMMITAMLIGFALDFLLGDPPRCPHVVKGMGWLIGRSESMLRKIFPPTPAGEFAGGVLLACLLPVVSCGMAWIVLWLAATVHPLLRLLVESLLIWQCLAMRSLAQAGSAVLKALEQGGLPMARRMVGRIVGRDTATLDERGVIRAAVETVAENTCDGVIAPLFYLALGGAPLGLLYKAINTMDSMIGYRNEQYLYFGRAAARLDDAANILPARLAALLMVLSGTLTAGASGRGAWRIYWRDRYKHKSPNAAHTEAAMAGALGIELGGDAYYGGRLMAKPNIGEAQRPPEIADIGRAIRILYCTAGFGMLLCLIIQFLIVH